MPCSLRRQSPASELDSGPIGIQPAEITPLGIQAPIRLSGIARFANRSTRAAIWRVASIPGQSNQRQGSWGDVIFISTDFGADHGSAGASRGQGRWAWQKASLHHGQRANETSRQERRGRSHHQLVRDRHGTTSASKARKSAESNSRQANARTEYTLSWTLSGCSSWWILVRSGCFIARLDRRIAQRQTSLPLESITSICVRMECSDC
jgi:hypothetical protein